MGFCCGASMIGTIGSLRQGPTRVHNVPLFYCPVCHQFEVHHAVRDEFELLVEYAQEDGAHEVNLNEYLDPQKVQEWKENCTSFEEDNPETVLREQIDMALDLSRVAKALEDEEWEEQLKNRLRVLSRRLIRFQQQRAENK
ncbi:hypothetical protein JIR001_04370 [Polycladomyces abyssicola]|jgi:hypothetical protein|uniref:Uncharacterized protein n=1 Tax=Polycladomyces abyssicola TaxID=1125966 RepID=A0A8D5ZJL6_9BACL|nr:hypothetical protein [Polycladomyces abyssicola]BCU80654.1 hypothetical protein JIR001_04370 [Polycladomyces abyssicola]